MRPTLAIFTLFVLGFASACSGNDNPAAWDPIEIEIGVVQSQSGSAALYGPSAIRGIELAIEEINAAGDLRLSATLLDDESNPAKGVEAFTTLTRQGVDAIIGPTLSNVALEAMPVAQQSRVPVLGATTTAAAITAMGDYVFRVALPESIVVPATIQYLAEQESLSRAVLILESADAFSRSSAAAMRAGIELVGATLVTEIDISEGGDIAARLAAIEGESIDAFLVTPLVNESARLIREIREAGFEQLIVGGNSFNTPEIAELAGPVVEGAYVGAAWNPGVSAEASQRFVAAYSKRYGVEPDLFAAQGYASVYVLADAVTRAGNPSPAALRDALAATAGVETPLGLLSMSPEREALHEPVIQQYRKGRLVAVR